MRRRLEMVHKVFLSIRDLSTSARRVSIVLNVAFPLVQFMVLAVLVPFPVVFGPECLLAVSEGASIKVENDVSYVFVVRMVSRKNSYSFSLCTDVS